MSSKKSLPKKFNILKIIRFFFIFFLVIALMGVGVGIGGYYYFSKDLPNIIKPEDWKPAAVTEVFDADGNKIGEFWSECRFLTPLQEIPEKIIKAFIASEDKNFYDHHGVDPWGIIRALINNLRAGHTVEGASTITQQLIKNILLTNERTYKRKIKEAILAYQIEANLGKDQILYLYLNQIFLGNRAHGVTAAARNYFHKSLKDLNIAEIAMIVGLSKAPDKYDPLKNPDRARVRQHHVLDRMVEEKFIKNEEAEEAKKTSLTLYKAAIEDKDFNAQYTPYLSEYVRNYLQDKYGKEGLYKSGWKVYTTFSFDMQKAAEKAVNRGVREVDHQHGFRGALKHLASLQEMEDFNAKNHESILEDAGVLSHSQYSKTDNILKMKTPLSNDRYYQALILSGSRSSGFEVQVGNQQGMIPRETTGWAYGADKLKAGDVVQVKLYRKAPAASAPSEKRGKKGKDAPPPVAALPTAPAEEKLVFALEQEPELQGALFSYEPFTGEIKAIVGGTGFKYTDANGKNGSELNRATQSIRQPGSSIKPLIYSAALDKGYTPNTVILDEPISYDDGSGIPWEPKNYGGGFSGATTFRNALVHSLNVVTVRIVMDIQIHYLDAYMRKLGITSPIKTFYSMALGASEVKLNELATAYGTFATGGILPKTFFIRKIVDPSGKVIEENKPMDPNLFIINWDDPRTHKGSSIPSPIPQAVSALGRQTEGAAKIPTESQPETWADSESQPGSDKLTTIESKLSEKKKDKTKKITWDEVDYNPDLLTAGEVAIQKDQLTLTEYEKKVLYGGYIPPGYAISPRTAATMVSLMQDVVRYGTGTRVLPLGKPAAGKTGTTNGATDTWFIGFTPTLVAGVWVGHDSPLKSVGHGATGGHVSAPIWLYYMTEATKRYPTKSFKIPSWIDLSKYQTPMQLVKGDTESIDFNGVIPGLDGTKSGGSGKGSGAEFFSKEL